MSQSYGNPTRTGVYFDFLNQSVSTGYDLSNHSTALPRFDPEATENESNQNAVNPILSKSRGRSGHLPNFLSAFGSLGDSSASKCIETGQSEEFFIPSYLKGSVYIQRLQKEYEAKHVLPNNNSSTHPSLGSSFSKSISSTDLNARMAPSHRGMTYDLIEKAPPSEQEPLPPLPSKWNNHDKQAALEVLSDGLEVRLSMQKPERDQDIDSCAIRANHPMPSQCGIYYFEVSILARKREESTISIGFSSKKVPLTRPPGWEPESWAYHGDDGDSFCSQPSGRGYGPSYCANDVIGCGVNFKTNSAFFTKNGIHLGTVFKDIKGDFYPSIGMKKPGEHIRVNFGQTPFIYDIDGMMEREKTLIQQEVNAVSTDKVAPPLRETELIQVLVLQFLKHDGYVESAREFAKEIYFEKKALSLNPETIFPDYDIKEEEDASHRQRIRSAILDGDIDTALRYTNLHFPQILRNNEKVYFRLRCRKFVEMIRKAAELQNKNQENCTKRGYKYDNERYEDIINNKMDVDGIESFPPNNEPAEADDTISNSFEHEHLLNETIKYGTELSAEFRDDPRKEVRKALEDAFALMAYQEPLNATGVSYLLDPSGRVAVAEELNSAILQSLGKSSSSALESLYQQTTVLLEDLREQGGSAADFLNIKDYSKPKPSLGLRR